ncbi:MAG: hypothetical protein ABIX36_17205 [Mucilaginibacter sp.]|uniref:hypothetical protein n=1 Tax=Mucilaginibacter sp. TaxID=1882438 RepID=UPI00326322B5
MIAVINTINDVNIFAKDLIAEGLNFHPDENFRNYVNLETGEDTYTVEEADIRNKLMTRCFEVCDREHIDIYNLTMEVFLKETGLDKYIPLPSSLLME